MPSRTEKRFLPYTPAQLFELVAAVDRYPEFLPWCLAARTRPAGTLPGTPRKSLFVADLVIGFRMMRARYTSRVTLQAPRRIDVTCIEGPFRYLNNHWTFEPVAPSAGRRHDDHLPDRVRVSLKPAAVIDGRAVRRGSKP